MAALRERYPEFADLRLLKSDTDGFEAILVPEVARVWADASPVLFFEWDMEVVHLTGREPGEVWRLLAGLGYTDLAVWDNEGRPLGQLPIDEAESAARVLELDVAQRGYAFWDVAARRADDTVAAAAFDRLVPRRYAGPR